LTEEFSNEAPQPEPTAEEPAKNTALASEAPAQTFASPIRLAASGLSDVGLVRTNNEDFFGYNESLGIYIVCDGMGGMASGEVASSLAANGILKSFASSANSGAPVSVRLLHAFNSANQEVWESGQAIEHKGMGTTAVAAALDGDKLIIGNVGDSRAYILLDGKCTQLTVDHSYINELIRNGTLTIESARTADLRGMESIITRAVGVAADVQPDFFSVDLKPGTGVLLASDGLSRYVTQEAIATILGASTFESACANLIHVAKERGGQDNITCLLLLVLPA
jgi:protein phosphatase